ncbi:SMP-30/gluconolactonase/LRE family protein [Aquincola tertiaricarbonis]|uniref:SMP-30/gluconolactonase/LRE family protein n=1 Tax=Aquincola tertiaricarbonis TaxID=391953 RepID=UPI0006151F36|nr:SMP-30/gluconolactonase/LRE family protein [Aquincola tertiaricarbonis]
MNELQAVADAVGVIPVAPSLLGESPMWHPGEQCLYWCDIPGHKLNRFDPASGRHDEWAFDTDVACCAPVLGGELLLALRSGLVNFDPRTGKSRPLAKPPYDPAVERFNDGKADPQGRMWAGTLYEPKDRPAAALYRWSAGKLTRQAEGVTTANGLAWSPDGRTAYWSDTKAHTIYAFDFDPSQGTLSGKRVWVQFPVKQPGTDLADYGGRPDGASVDTEGCYWVAMFEGARVLRLSPRGEVLREVRLPVRCPTMPCFGGPDLKTLYITTGRENRPADELARTPWAGAVLTLQVDVPGLPANFARP